MSMNFQRHCLVVRPELGRTLLPDSLLLQVPAMPVRELLSDEAAKRRRMAAESDELRSEGRVHVNTRVQRHE